MWESLLPSVSRAASATQHEPSRSWKEFKSTESNTAEHIKPWDNVWWGWSTHINEAPLRSGQWISQQRAVPTLEVEPVHCTPFEKLQRLLQCDSSNFSYVSPCEAVRLLYDYSSASDSATRCLRYDPLNSPAEGDYHSHRDSTPNEWQAE
ncbi:hypothetical protein MUK42_27124 [Musa troglodytarum]|uniref:Uncharacterized protein n=1 Tax=Musa troglodytarum TaxID=320322 RepID=A0A9E7FB67_9LILI|nr:hypothetical protein MUK42_27124 [Musa troglodytarum]